MSARGRNNSFFDFLNAAFSVVSGAISGTTPKPSTWIRVIGVESLQLNISTTSTVAGSWTVFVATDFRGQDAVALDPRYIRNAAGVQTALPVPAGSPLGPTVFAFFIPDGRYTHFQIIFTPTSGAGNAVADTGLITSIPYNVSKISGGHAIDFETPSTSTHAGTGSIDYAMTYFCALDAFAAPPKQADGTDDPVIYFPAIDTANAAITIAAIVSGAQTICKRLGNLEVMAIRAKYAPTSGFGRIKANLNAKAAG